ncbi:response regulator [Pararhizobium sp. DWP3-4]|uniref:response regulator n=1 Tax=unclassified Pararhizobium TaxID=2643050 RepID=UPI003CEC8811
MPHRDLSNINKANANIILILEDEPLIAMDFEQILKNAGFTTHICYSCSEASAWLADHSPDAAILDICLKDGSCTGVASRLHQNSIPFIVCSGSTQDEIDPIFIRGEWVSKPCQPKILVNAIKNSIAAMLALREAIA